MKRIALVLLALATLSCAANERPAVYRISYGRPFGGGPDGYTMILEGKVYTSRNAFIAAVAKLPARSRLVWSSGCMSFDEIPLGPSPRMSIAAFRAFCQSRGIRFEYHCGFPEPRLVRKTFSVPSGSWAERSDVREWLQSCGVTFPSGSAARWQPSKHTLTILNTEENLDLIKLLLQTAESK